MGEWVPFPGFCDQTYKQQSVNLSIDRAINCFVSTNQIGTDKGGKSMVSRPGLQAFSAPTTGTGRGLLAGDERMFTVVGSTLYEILSDGTPTSLGAVGGGADPCTIFANSLGSQLLIGNPNTGVTYVANGVTVTAATTPVPFWMWAFLDGKAYAVGQNSNVIYSSAVNDFTSWDPLDKALSLATSDRVAQIYAYNEQLVIFGRETTQFWYNTGQGGFSLQRVPQAFITQGIASSFGMCQIGGQLLALSDSVNGAGRVLTFRQGVATPVSTYAIEQLMQSYNTNLGEATAYGYEANGHQFYCLNFTSQASQLVYDISENSWHERNGWTGSAYSLYSGQFHCCTFNNTHFVQNKATGAIYKQLEALTTDFGSPFRRERVSPILYSGKRTIFNALRVDQLQGTPTVVTSPAAGLSCSRDGGWTFDASYTTTTAGENGEAGVVEWRRLGQASPLGFAVSVVWDGGGALAFSGAQVNVTPCEA